MFLNWVHSYTFQRIIGINEDHPTRPVIEIVVNSQGLRCKEKRIIDLADASVIHIRDAVDETKLNIADKKLALSLRVNRWWVKDAFRK